MSDTERDVDALATTNESNHDDPYVLPEIIVATEQEPEGELESHSRGGSLGYRRVWRFDESAWRFDRLKRQPTSRAVIRVVRHVDPWSVFKIALVANFGLYLIVLVAGVMLWNVADVTGTVDNVERFFESFGWSSFDFNGGEIYHNAWIAGLFVVIGLTGLAVLLATLFNLITDLVGGIRLTVVEEEVVESQPSPMRRFALRRIDPRTTATAEHGDAPDVAP